MTEQQAIEKIKEILEDLPQYKRDEVKRYLGAQKVPCFVDKEQGEKLLSAIQAIDSTIDDARRSLDDAEEEVQKLWDYL